MTNEIKQCCLNKAKLYTRYIKNGRSVIGQQDLQNASNYSTNLIKEANKKYLCSLGNKLNDPKLGAKAVYC